MDKSLAFFFETKHHEREWSSAASGLQEHLALLEDKKTVKNFGQFLEVPYLHIGTRHARVFDKIRPVYQRNSGEGIKVSALIRAVFKNSDYDKHGADVLGIVNDLPGKILRFIALGELDRDPVATLQFATAAIQDKGHVRIYSNLQKRWAKEAEGLPLGRKAFYHRWAAADAGHFRVDVVREKSRHGNYGSAEHRLEEYHRYEAQIYRLEKESAARIFGEPLDDRAGAAPENPLLRLYADVIQLSNDEEASIADYLPIKAQFKAIQGEIDLRDWLALYLTIQNFLNALSRREENPEVIVELYRWSKASFDSGYFQRFESLTKSFVLNRLHHAFQLRDEDLVNGIIRELIPKVPDKDREWTMYIAEIGRRFYEHQYAKVVQDIRGENGEYGRSVYSGQTRLKSYLIRSCLVLVALEHPEDTFLKEALKDFKTFLNRHAKNDTPRFKEMQNFYNACMLIQASLKRGSLGVDGDRIQGEILTQYPMHAKGWLLHFIELVKSPHNRTADILKPMPTRYPSEEV